MSIHALEEIGCYPQNKSGDNIYSSLHVSLLFLLPPLKRSKAMMAAQRAIFAFPYGWAAAGAAASWALWGRGQPGSLSKSCPGTVRRAGPSARRVAAQAGGPLRLFSGPCASCKAGV